MALCLVLAAFLGAAAAQTSAAGRAEPGLLADPGPSPEDLYRAVVPAVHMIAAATSIEDIKGKHNINQGSAVAIGERELLTNCHVIKDRPLIFLLRSGEAHAARLARSDIEDDLCTLSVSDVALKPVTHIRPFATLVVGEHVYTVGSPRGLENTLGDGLIAGLRRRNGLRLVQITAPISQGSSGGALFDRFGNLIGVTSFFLSEAQAVNFAIAVDDFAKVASLPQPAIGAPPVALPPAPAPIPGALPPASVPVPPVAAAPASPRGYRIELTVARSDEEARKTWTYLNERYGDLLKGLHPETQRFELANKGTYYRLLAGVIQDQRTAGRLCAEITQRGHASCTVR